jgi:uncharacterized protein YbbK (DUF523 family)
VISATLSVDVFLKNIKQVGVQYFIVLEKFKSCDEGKEYIYHYAPL